MKVVQVLPRWSPFQADAEIPPRAWTVAGPPIPIRTRPQNRPQLLELCPRPFTPFTNIDPWLTFPRSLRGYQVLDHLSDKVTILPLQAWAPWKEDTRTAFVL